MIKQYYNRLIKDRTARSSLINLIIKPLSLVLSLVYTPMLLNYLGSEKYGLWATILSITSWINYCDVGIGHGLRNLLAGQIAKNEMEEVKKSISTAYVCMTMIAGILLVITALASIFVNWNWVFNTTIDMTLTVILSFIFICINFVLALSNTILYAMQKSELVSVRSIMMQGINIIGIFFLSKVSEGNLVLVSILFGAGTMITYLLNTIRLLKEYAFFRPSLRLFEKKYIKSICNVGIKFFVIQIAVILMYTVDNLLISRYFGAEAVTPYSMINRIYTAGYGFFTAIMVPIWSASTAEIAKGNFKWFEKAIKKLNIVTLIFSIGYIVVGVLFVPLSEIWLGQRLDYPAGLLTVMVVYYILQSIQNPYCQMNNVIGALNGQVILGIVQGVVNVPLSIWLATSVGLGVVGIKLATTILMGVGTIFQPIYYYRTISNIKQRN